MSSQKTSGIRTVLQYTGIPTSWLQRPKLPSRNWLIFIGVTSSITSLYIYDRNQCKHIRQEYVDRVKHLAEIPNEPTDLPRKVTVYGAKWPGDEEVEQGLKYFRKYVKPVLVAAAVDYDMVKVKRQGELTHLVSDKIKAKRRVDDGVEKIPEALGLHPMAKSPEEQRQHELDGGIILIGRSTFKEFMEGLKRGWTDSYYKVDVDQVLANELELDGRFDEPLDEGETDDRAPPPVFNPFLKSTSPPSPSPQVSGPSVPPPNSIPALPPILFVPFTNYIGFTQIPLMIWGFFNERHKVRAGAEAAYRLVMGNTRPFVGPTSQQTSEDTAIGQGGDLDFDLQAEAYYKSSLKSIPEDTEKYRSKYYGELPKKLETARALARGTREPTKDELAYPPPTEVELREERMKKEKRWRNEIEGWSIVNPDQKVAWDDRFQDILRVFIDPVATPLIHEREII